MVQRVVRVLKLGLRKTFQIRDYRAAAGVGPPASLFKLSSNLLNCPSSSQQGVVLPPRHVWGSLWLSHWGCSWHGEWGPNIPQCTGQILTTKNCSPELSTVQDAVPALPQSLAGPAGALAPELLFKFLSLLQPTCVHTPASFPNSLLHQATRTLRPSRAGSGVRSELLGMVVQVLSYLLFMKALQHCARMQFLKNTVTGS